MDTMLSRIDLTLKKLIVLFAVNSKLDHPSGECVEQACSLFDYLYKMYSLFSTDINTNDDVHCQQRIIEVIEEFFLKHGEHPKKQDIIRWSSRKFTLDMIKRNLQLMVEMEVIKETLIKKGARGPASTRYAV